MINIGIPSKGRLRKNVLKVFSKKIPAVGGSISLND